MQDIASNDSIKSNVQPIFLRVGIVNMTVQLLLKRSRPIASLAGPAFGGSVKTAQQQYERFNSMLCMYVTS